MKRSHEPFDLTVNGTGFLLARQDQLRSGGARAYSRNKPDRVTVKLQLPGVVPGEREGEVGWYWNNDPAQGWGEGRLRGEASYAYARNVDLRFPGMAFCAPLINSVALGVTPGAAPRVIYEHPKNTANIVYIGAGRYLRRLDPTNTADFTTVLDVGSGNAIAQVAVMDNYAWISTYVVSTRAPGPIYRHANSGSPGFADTLTKGTDAGGTDATAYGLCRSSKSTGMVLYRAYLNSGVPSIATGASGADLRVEANWGTGEDITLAFGNSSYHAYWLAEYGKQVYGALADGVYGFDEDLIFTNLIPETWNFQDYDNGVGMRVWHGSLIIPLLRGVYAYNGAVADVGPITGATLRADEDSRPFGLPTSGVCADSEWLIVPHYNGTDSYIFVARQDGEQLIWHPLIYRAGEGPFTAGHITNKGGQTIVLLVDESGVRHWTLPSADNPLQDSTAVGFAASGRLVLPATDFGLPGVSGTLDQVVIEGEELSASNYLTVSYRMAESGSLTSLGNVTSSPTTLTVSGATGSVCQIVIDFVRGGASTTTPILRSVFVRGTKRPSKAVVHEATVQIADEHLDRFGNPRPESAAALLSALTDLEGGTTKFSVTDPFGSTYDALLDGPVQVQEAAQYDQSEPVYLATFRWRAV